MGIPVTASLHNLIERVSLPFNEFLGLTKPVAEPHHDLLWDCYLSGQMNETDLEREVQGDPAFGVFVTARLRHHHEITSLELNHEAGAFSTPQMVLSARPVN